MWAAFSVRPLAEPIYDVPISCLRARLHLSESNRIQVAHGERAHTALPNWREAYWDANLPCLKAIKSRFDPDNVFRHAQSI